MKKVYMHTINGQPSEFSGGQISYSNRKIRLFAKNLYQIQREQQVSIAYRLEKGLRLFEYNYHILYLPEYE